MSTVDHKKEARKLHVKVVNKESVHTDELWIDGLICAFEFVRGHHPANERTQLRKQDWKNGLVNMPVDQRLNKNDSKHSTPLIDLELDRSNLGTGDDILPQDDHMLPQKSVGGYSNHCWVPIGWSRIAELGQMVQSVATWETEEIDLMEDSESHLTVADVAAPYWENPVGPTWWCHVMAGHPVADAWLRSVDWLHPAVCIALIDESLLISEKMKHLLYEVPVRAAGGLLFELLGQSVGDPAHDEDDIPIVLRSWQAQKFLITALHVKGCANNTNVLGITEVQELLLAGGSATPRNVNEVVAQLASRLARWDDRLWRKYVFGAADEIELKFVNRRNHDDLNLLSVIFNQEIRRLATQVIRVKWSLHAREEIIYELLQYMRGQNSRALLESVKKSTRQMLEEQEAVRGRLFTIQDVMQSTVRAWLQDKSLRITHNLTIFGGCGLILSIFTGLFGINVDGIPGAHDSPYAFLIFSGLLFFAGLLLIVAGMLYFGLKDPISEEMIQVRKLELQELVSMFQHEAETHAKVRDGVSRHNLHLSASNIIDDKDYVLIA